MDSRDLVSKANRHSCPYCGSLGSITLRMENTMENTREAWSGECANCHSSGPRLDVNKRYFISPESAVEAWGNIPFVWPLRILPVVIWKK